MITRIQALNFRSLRYVDQSLTGFQAIVGPNGAGKSSFLDVVSFISDIVRVGVQSATIGDPSNGIATRSSDPRVLTWMHQGGKIELAIEMQVPDQFITAGRRNVRYEVGLQVPDGPGPLEIFSETLYLGVGTQKHLSLDLSLFPEAENPPSSILISKKPGEWKVLISKTEGGKDYFQSETTKFRTQFNLGKSRSALASLPGDETLFPVALWARDFLQQSVQRIQLDAESMRLASPPGLGESYRANGANLPWVVNRFRRVGGETRYRLWVAHVADAVPGVKDIRVVVRDDDRYSYLVAEFENGLIAPSWALSDGTLRIIALTLLAYLGLEGAMLLIEEPENGIHPRAIQSVVDALRQVSDGQVIMASHSPVVLGSLEPRDVLCFAKDATGATAIVNGNDHPTLRDWRDRPDLGQLLIAGVLD
jgi:ABC-type transport system involved in cytochrome c biogenesis ATPase subunit